MRTSPEGAILNMKWQVVEVHKPLLSVGKMNEQGHECVFKKDEAYIQLANGSGKLPLRKNGGVYELEVWLRSPDFTGQS